MISKKSFIDKYNDLALGVMCKIVIFILFDHFIPTYGCFMVFLGLGMISMILDTFKYHLSETVIFGSLKGLQINFDLHLLIYVSDHKSDYANRFGTSTLGL